MCARAVHDDHVTQALAEEERRVREAAEAEARAQAEAERARALADVAARMQDAGVTGEALAMLTKQGMRVDGVSE